MNVLAVIPARSGSKSVPDKNIRMFHGKPMLAYSIEHALASKYINRVMVSTDSEQYAAIAREYGAEVPFLRPKEFAQDDSLDLEVFEHVLMALKEKEGYEPDVIVQLRPTYPIRRNEDIDAAIELILSDEAIDSVRSLAPAKETPYKMWKMEEEGRLFPLMDDIKECYNMPRQKLPKVYYQNACIDVLRPRAVLKLHSMSGEVIYGYPMQENYDIDTTEEWYTAEQAMKKQDTLKRIQAGGLRFVFDIDGVVAQFEKSLDYAKAGPNSRMIEIVNRLYEYNNHIVLFTARGYVTGMDWSETTRKQLEAWGVKYHELLFGKPNADYYIDDKMLGLEDLYLLFS